MTNKVNPPNAESTAIKIFDLEGGLLESVDAGTTEVDNGPKIAEEVIEGAVPENERKGVPAEFKFGELGKFGSTFGTAVTLGDPGGK